MAYRFEPGQVIGGFLLEERLHQGGMATLWRVSHPDHDQSLAMKIPRMAWGEGAGAIVGFEAEQMILPRLSGPHAPRFIAAEFTDRPYLVMELIERSTLRPLLDRLPLPFDEVATIGAKVAIALHDLHHQHVVHRDLKPSNVMMRPSGEAELIDFGLSRHDQLPDLLAEETPLPVGTAPYIAPEQVLGVRSDPRSDLFSLGVMLYFFTTGQRPFGNPTSRRKLRARLYRDPVPPRALRADCPPWLQEVILRCLEVDPAKRYQSAAQLALALRHSDEMELTTRAERTRRDPLRAVMGRWAKARRLTSAAAPTVSAQLARAPIILASIDVAPEGQMLAEALRTTVRRILEIEPGARLVCVNVLKISRIGIDLLEDEHGRNLHVQRLVELRAWARPLGAKRVSFHVLEAPDPATALLDYARRNEVDHIVIGARGSSAVRRYLGSVSAQVVAQAPCPVTVVRARESRPAEADLDKLEAHLTLPPNGNP